MLYVIMTVKKSAMHHKTIMRHKMWGEYNDMHLQINALSEAKIKAFYLRPFKIDLI